MLFPFYAAEAQDKDQDPEVAYIGEKPDPSIEQVVEKSQKEAHTGRRILGILLPTTHRPTVIPYSWR